LTTPNEMKLKQMTTMSADIRMIAMEGFIATYRKNRQQTPPDSNVNSGESNKSQGMPTNSVASNVIYIGEENVPFM